ncbi:MULTISPECIES: branched-chain amino acid ABC transporter permease [unclassified Haladaptatus]|uniref:branched-chain amino acid ABC transporter permease n=1 Tax=unclassified Haladaptatus TaxID=2622732 RepID=UPI0023E8D63F|nr:MULTISPECIES: branched-chain amino acid ABC transporter permease [unclassified Haladaptatus]
MVDAGNLFATIVAGIGIGAIYALIAMGFSLIYKVTGVLNFAQGQLALVGAYFVAIFAAPSIVWFVPSGSVAGLGGIGALVATILVGILLGILLERAIFRFFIGEPVLSVIIVTLALGGIFSGFIRFLVGPNFRAYPASILPDWNVPLPLGAEISGPFAIGVVLSLAVVIALMLFFRYTVTGSILRAAASDQQAAMALGVSIERTIIIAWTLSIAITAIGGILLAMANGGAGFNIETTGIIIFVAVVFGGLDSVPGAFIGAIVVGLLQELGTFYVEPIVGPGFGPVLPLIFLLFIIVVLPYGLFGTERIERI